MPLIETIIGFAVIMLLLSFLVKSMASVVKNHIDYYSENLKGELDRLLRGTINMGLTAAKARFPGLGRVEWRRLGEEYLNRENIEWLLRELGATTAALQNLEGRLEVHRANLRYAFAKRTNNMALALGLALCLLLNINAFTIWDTLYRDQDVRAKFSSAEYVDSAMKLEKQYEAEIKKAKEKEKQEELRKRREAVAKQIRHFRGEVTFGVGRIWNEAPKDWWPWFFLYEFLGSLLTGILVSLGAPYWQDLLKGLISLRAGKGKGK